MFLGENKKDRNLPLDVNFSFLLHFIKNNCFSTPRTMSLKNTKSKKTNKVNSIFYIYFSGSRLRWFSAFLTQIYPRGGGMQYPPSVFIEISELRMCPRVEISIYQWRNIKNFVFDDKYWRHCSFLLRTPVPELYFLLLYLNVPEGFSGVYIFK